MPSFKVQIVIDASAGFTSEQAAELEQHLRGGVATDDLSPFGKYALRLLDEQGMEAVLLAAMKQCIRNKIHEELNEAFDDSIRFKMAPPAVILTPKEAKNVSN